jgi:hypothetical protein
MASRVKGCKCELKGAGQMTDYNVRDVFFLFTGRCGHKWVGDAVCDACPTCGDRRHMGGGHVWGENVVTHEPIAVDFAYVLDKVQRRIKRAIRENRRKKRKTVNKRTDNEMPGNIIATYLEGKTLADLPENLRPMFEEVSVAGLTVLRMKPSN